MEGLIHGGAYTWRGLFSEFYGIHFISLSFGTAVVQEKQALGRHYKGDFKARTVNGCSLRQEE